MAALAPQAVAKFSDRSDSAIAPLRELPVKESGLGKGWQVATGVASASVKVPVAGPAASGAVKSTVPSAEWPAVMVTGEVLVTLNAPVATKLTCASRLPELRTWKLSLVVSPGGREPNDPKVSVVFQARTAPLARSVTFTRCWSSLGTSV